MENNRIVLFNILKKRTKCILQSLHDNNNNLIRDVRELFSGHSGVRDEELENIETVDHLWDFLVRKKVISMDKVQKLEYIAGYVNSNELKNEVKEYKNDSSGMVQETGLKETCLSVLKDGTKEAVIILKTALKTGVQVAVFCRTVSYMMESFHDNPEVLQTLLIGIIPYGMDLIGLKKGSLCFVLKTSSLSSLKQLWTSYKDGSLEKKFKKVINEIDEVRKLTQGTEIDVTVEIDEDEYREACWVLVQAKIDQAEAEKAESSKSVQRLHRRRHSLSCEREFLPSRDQTQLSWQEWRTLKEVEKKLENETRRRIYVEKQNEELREQIQLLKGTKDTSKSKKEDIPVMALKEKNQELMAELETPKAADSKTVEKLKKAIEYGEEIQLLKGTKDTSKSKKEDIMALKEKNQELMAELETPKAADSKTVEKLKKAIEYGEEMLKIAVEANDQIEVGNAYTKGVLYYALGIVYKETDEKENFEDTIMKKAESYFREAVDSLEKLNAQLSNEDEMKSLVDHSLFITYEFLTKVLMATKQIEEALVISDCTRDRGLVHTMIEKFQMNPNEIVSESMRYSNISCILENENVSIVIYAVREDKINICTLEYQKPSLVIEKMVPHESEEKTSVDTYITNLVDAACVSYDQEKLEQLYELLIAPVVSNLTQDKLVIIADGPLQLIPYAALLDPKTGQFLSEIKCIRYAPSLTAMKVWKECPVDYHGNTGALVIGDPDVGRVMITGQECEVARSPFAPREAKDVSGILNVSPLVGPQVTKDEVLKGLQDHLAVIHIAALGNHKGILLAPSASKREVKVPEEEDYLLTMEEVQEMHVRAQLVVLSVSDSGRGEITRGVVECMARAFLAAGARAVVASLWPYHDLATLRFMSSFHASLKKGDSASKSLQNAMDDIRGVEGYKDPKFWAPFFLIGDDVTISA